MHISFKDGWDPAEGVRVRSTDQCTANFPLMLLAINGYRMVATVL
jgi:hypothetical protein